VGVREAFDLTARAFDGTRRQLIPCFNEYQRTLDVFTQRFLGGTDTKISTSRAAANLQASVSQIAALQRQITQQEDAVGVLLGTNPGPIDRGMPLIRQTSPSTSLDARHEVRVHEPDGRPHPFGVDRHVPLGDRSHAAEQLLYPAEAGLAQTERDQLLAVVSLYKALGGGWQTPGEQVRAQ
jgi:outer membrane protein TolC